MHQPHAASHASAHCTLSTFGDRPILGGGPGSQGFFLLLVFQVQGLWDHPSGRPKCALGLIEKVLQNSAGSKAVWLLGSGHTASRGGTERHCSRVGLAQQTPPGAIPTLSWIFATVGLGGQLER